MVATFRGCASGALPVAERVQGIALHHLLDDLVWVANLLEKAADRAHMHADNLRDVDLLPVFCGELENQVHLRW